MGTNITLSSAVRSNLLSLQNTADLLSGTQERLATGKKINSALDDATAFFTASSLNGRASDLSRLQDFVGNAVQTLKAADEGITALTNLVGSAEATVRQAFQTSASTARIVSPVSGVAASDTVLAAFGIDNTDILVIGDGSETTAFAATGTSTVQDFLDAINNNTDNTDIRASLTGDGALKLEATGSNEITAQLFDISGDGDTLANNLGFTHISGQTIANAGTTSADRTSFSVQFDELRSQIDQLVGDAGYNGVNLLRGDSLTVTFNENGSSQLSIAGTVFDADGLNISAASNAFQTDFDIDTALTELSAAAATLRSQASKFGSNLSVVEIRQEFTKALVNVLETGAANLTLADTNEEGANLLALQTRQQLSATALSLASQADQNVLRLF